MTIDVSVIIACYNAGAYIEAAVGSALIQEDVSLEIIIVDDASTDNSWQVISAMTDPRIKRHRLMQNSGAGAARNAGIAMASGKWIAILDGDDMFFPSRLKTCLKHTADIIVDNITVLREDDSAQFSMFSTSDFSALKTLDLATLINGKTHPRDQYTLGYLKPIFSHAFLQRNTLSYLTDIRIGEDYLLLAQSLALGATCAVEPSSGYRYTARKGSTSHRLKLSDISAMMNADKHYTNIRPLSAAAHKAQAKRELWLRREFGFTLLVSAIKARHLGAFLQAILRYPSSIFQLYRPVAVRLCRFLGVNS